MLCYVYKGERKPDHYLFVDRQLEQLVEDAQLPAAISTLMGDLEFVLEFELTPDRKLSQADANQVLADIESQGFYLQMPKKDLRAEEDRLFS